MSPRSGIGRSRGAASARSCPAQNPLPDPVRTTARTVSSLHARDKASQSSRAIDRLKLLRTSGRLSVTVATPSAVFQRMSVMTRGHETRDGGHVVTDKVRAAAHVPWPGLKILLSAARPAVDAAE